MQSNRYNIKSSNFEDDGIAGSKSKTPIYDANEKFKSKNNNDILEEKTEDELDYE